MFKLMSIITVLFASQSLFANTYNVPLGQSADIQAGDVAILRDANNQVSVVSCNGGVTQPTLPARTQFQVDRSARFDDIFQKASDNDRQIQCGAFSGETQVHQAMSDALNAAREQCFDAGYQNCAQPVTSDEQYSFHVTGGPGGYFCDVLARIVGTQPN